MTWDITLEKQNDDICEHHRRKFGLIPDLDMSVNCVEECDGESTCPLGFHIV